MNLPVEVLERILSKCDGRTLLNAREVTDILQSIVDRLFKKYPLWKWFCNEEIPENELLEYLEKYSNPKDPDKWQHIYENWLAWQDIDNNIDFDIIKSPAEIPRITCIAVSGRYIAVGSEDGRIRVYNDKWNLLYTERHLSARVTSIKFVSDLEKKWSENAQLFLVIAYHRCQTLIFAEYKNRNMEPLIVRDVKAHSVFSKYVCYEKVGGRISVIELNCDSHTGTSLSEITFVRIYSPNEVTCLNIWQDVCTFLVNSKVQILKYNSRYQSAMNVEDKTRIESNLKNLYWDDMNDCRIYRDDIIIGLSNQKSEVNCRNQFLELFILGNKNEYSQKVFDCWDILHGLITCTYLYGNTFVIGVDAGAVYFYQIDSWKTFDVRNYQHKEIVGQHPIIAVDVKETKMERKFYVTSNFSIHEIVGFSIPMYLASISTM